MKNHLHMSLMALTDLHVPAVPLRIHPPAKIRKLHRHVERYGIILPLLIDGDRCVVDGVARYQVAVALGLHDVHVVSVAHLTSDEIRALRLALNRLQEEVTWDKEVVAGELRHLVEVGFELDFTGFDTVEIENFLEIGGTPADVEDLDAGLAAGPVVSRAGDVWLLDAGSLHHRIACGDCLYPELRQALMQQKKAAACFADPPYNVRIDGHVSGTGRHGEFAMGSGEMTDAEFEIFLAAMFEVVEEALERGGVAYICMDWRHLRHLLNAAQRRSLELLNLAVWVKSNAGMGSFLRSQHELIGIFKRAGASHRNNIELGRHGRSRANVWEYRGVNVHSPERHLLDLHPTVKPAAMVADAIRDVTMPGELVFDPFLGSGTTLIAAQRTGRSCLGIEIEPRFVDLAIRRWQAETGRVAVRDVDWVSFADAEEAANQETNAASEVRP